MLDMHVARIMEAKGVSGVACLGSQPHWTAHTGHRRVGQKAYTYGKGWKMLLTVSDVQLIPACHLVCVAAAVGPVAIVLHLTLCYSLHLTLCYSLHNSCS